MLRRPALIPVPLAGPRLLLGAEGAAELATGSQRVRPAALAAAGHPFRYPGLEGALRHVLGREPGGRQRGTLCLSRSAAGNGARYVCPASQGSSPSLA